MSVLGRAARAFAPRRKRHDLRDEPGGERIVQERLGTTERAQQFYDRQVTSHLTPAMRQFIQRMEMAFIATSNSAGECDCSLRAGPAGFITIVDERTIAYPEYRGNPRHKGGGDYFGVAASKSATAHCPPGEPVHGSPAQAPTGARVSA
jgi:Pyridoxamine 5'-phosphate oxidase